MPVKTATSNPPVKDRRYFDLLIDSACYILYTGLPFGTGDTQHFEVGFGKLIGNPWRSDEKYFSISPVQAELSSDFLINASAMRNRRSLEMPLGFLDTYTLGLTDFEPLPFQTAAQGSVSTVNAEIEENPIGHIEAPIINIYRLKIMGRSEAVVYPSPVRELDESS